MGCRPKEQQIPELQVASLIRARGANEIGDSRKCTLRVLQIWKQFGNTVDYGNAQNSTLITVVRS